MLHQRTTVHTAVSFKAALLYSVVIRSLVTRGLLVQSAVCLFGVSTEKRFGGGLGRRMCRKVQSLQQLQ